MTGQRSRLDDFRILVADTNSHSASLTAAMLRSANARAVTTVENGAAALAALQTSAYDALVMDGHLGPAGAIALIRQIRGPDNPGTRTIPIIVICDRGIDEKVRAALGAGVSAIVIRPVSASALALRIRQAIALPTVAAPGYAGPDRRRRDAGFEGKDRRHVDRESDKSTGEEV